MSYILISILGNFAVLGTYASEAYCDNAKKIILERVEKTRFVPIDHSSLLCLPLGN